LGYFVWCSYTPEVSAGELKELAFIVSGAGRLIVIHSGSYYPGDTNSLVNILELGMKFNVRLVISHLVYIFAGVSLGKAVEIIRRYRTAGADV
jgi:hypothetical protein